MTVLAATGSGGKLLWYLTRSSGAVALILLTLAVVLGVLDVRRWSRPGWPRFLLDALHRNASLLACVFLVIHILTSVLDGYTSIPLIDAVVPFVGSYRPFWLGLGALAFDLLLALLVTSLLRARLGQRAWRGVHWLAYACWPIALLHGLGTGSDASSAWLLVISLLCLALVVAAVLVRALGDGRRHLRASALALGTTSAFATFLVLWLPGGPLGSEWARRAGTPAKLLAAPAGVRQEGLR
jgi:sulfoxide reductase heme-binding subunit YedZ